MTASSPEAERGRRTPSTVARAPATSASAPPGRPTTSRTARRRTSRSDANHDLVERLALEVGHVRVLRGIADRDQDERPLVLRPAENLAEEPHRARRVRERAEAGSLQRGEQEADGDADRLAHVVVLDLLAVL